MGRRALLVSVPFCLFSASSLTGVTDLSCIVLFGACIEGVVLRDKYDTALLCAQQSWLFL